jgi:hypothetical protein
MYEYGVVAVKITVECNVFRRVRSKTTGVSRETGAIVPKYVVSSTAKFSQ